MREILIYGATGYTGRLIAEAMVARGLAPLLAGRDAEGLAALAERLGLRRRSAPLSDPRIVDSLLRDVDVLVNAAGPFSRTAMPLFEACLRSETHYLDITGEVDVMTALRARDTEAREAGILLMPGVGFDVVPSDCLASHVASRAPGASWLALGIRGLVSFTRGSLRTLAEQVDKPVRIRRGGVLRPVPAGEFGRSFPYDDAEPSASQAVSWGDLVSAHHTTGIPDIEVYFESTPAVEAMLVASRRFGRVLGSRLAQTLLRSQAALFPEGPSEAERRARRATIVAEVGDDHGVLARARLHTPEAYTFTGRAAAAVAEEVSKRVPQVGYQTPATQLGADFVLGFADVVREDLEVPA